MRLSAFCALFLTAVTPLFAAEAAAEQTFHRGEVIVTTATYDCGPPGVSLNVAVFADGEIKPLLHPFPTPFLNSPRALAPDAAGGMHVLWSVYYDDPRQKVVFELRHFDRDGTEISTRV